MVNTRIHQIINEIKLQIKVQLYEHHLENEIHIFVSATKYSAYFPLLIENDHPSPISSNFLLKFVRV